MRAILAVTTLAALAAFAGCAGKGQNTTDIYAVRQGQIQLTATVDESQASTINAVEFSVDNNPIGTDSQGPEWSVQFDTTKLTNGVHYVKAVGNPGTDNIDLLENTIIVNNPGGAPAGGQPAGGQPAADAATPAAAAATAAP